METMKAVRIHSFGGLEVLQYEETPCPEIGDQEVLVRVHAAGVNPLDWKVRQGYLNGWIDHSLPLVLGWDLSGVVEATGPGVTDFSPGQAVFGRADVSRDGTYAEYVVVRAAEVSAKPKSVDHDHAAAIPQATLAAWQALFNGAGLSSGQTVLIHGAAGGVGTFAVQLAKLRGARVIGTASENHLDFLRELGVDEVIEYNKTRFEQVVQDADVVLDLVGGETLERSWAVLKPGGVLVSIVDMPSEETAAAHGVQQRFATAELNPAILPEMAALVDAGQIKPVVSTILPLNEVRQAHTISQSMHALGKIVLHVAD